MALTDLHLELSNHQVTNEPPAGLKAGILRSYTVIVDQERLERVETTQWRQLLFALCFLHSVVSNHGGAYICHLRSFLPSGDAKGYAPHGTPKPSKHYYYWRQADSW